MHHTRLGLDILLHAICTLFVHYIVQNIIHIMVTYKFMSTCMYILICTLFVEFNNKLHKQNRIMRRGPILNGLPYNRWQRNHLKITRYIILNTEQQLAAIYTIVYTLTKGSSI